MQKESKNESKDTKIRHTVALQTPTDLSPDATRGISGALNLLLADTLALYVKTKNSHWHISGPHFRDYHLLLDEQAGQIFAVQMRSPSAFARSEVRCCAP
jgi:starvation-inducible DNA-binding protein